MDINFDLDVNNYNISDLKKFFNLPNNYSIELLNSKVADMEYKIINVSLEPKYKKDIIHFIKLSKEILVSAFNDIQNTVLITNKDIIKEPTILLKNHIGKVINPLAVHPAMQHSNIAQNDITGYNYNDITSVYIFNTVTRENYFASSSTNCTFNLPLKIKNVLSISLASLQLPNVFFAFSSERGTNQIFIFEDESELSGIVTLPDGNYTNTPNVVSGAPSTSIGTALQKAINEQILNITDPSLYRFFVNVDPITNFTHIRNNSSTFHMKLITNNILFIQNTNNNKHYLHSKPNTEHKLEPSEYTNTLGYLLGFRDISYEGETSYVSESTFNGVYSSYLYFALNDYTGSQQISTTYGVLQNSLIDDNVLAVIPLNGSTYSYIFENNSNLIYKRRDYFGPVDISKISIKLLSPFGEEVNLMRNDFSFSLTVTSNYNIKKSDIPNVTPII